MRIGLARRGYSSTGGAENYLRRLAIGLEAAGHETVLFADSSWPPEQWPGRHFQLVPDAGSPRAFADGVDRLLDSKTDPSAAAPSCDFLFSLERLWWCDCFRAGDGVHRAWSARRTLIESRWRTWFRRLMPKHEDLLGLEASLLAGGGAKRVIANSKLVRDEIEEYYGYPREKIAVVPNGLPAEYFARADALGASPEQRAAARTALGLHPSGDEECVLLFAGSGWERKGLLHALVALQLVLENNPQPAPVMLVAGRGNPLMYLARLLPGTRKRVRFLGPVADMPALYAAADVFVLPTLYDPFSNACLEALAAGLPVITTRGNGFGEILAKGREGEVLDELAEDFVDALAAAMQKWLDPARRARARALCAEKARRYTIEENVRQTLKFLKL